MTRTEALEAALQKVEAALAARRFASPESRAALIQLGADARRVEATHGKTLAASMYAAGLELIK